MINFRFLALKLIFNCQENDKISRVLMNLIISVNAKFFSASHVRGCGMIAILFCKRFDAWPLDACSFESQEYWRR